VHTILVVEDEFGAADVLMTALEDEGYRVVLAANGRQALERLAEIRPDLIIADFMMPIMDGAAMARVVRGDPEKRAIPIVMTSAVSEQAMRQQFNDFQVFLRKPFRVNELLEIVGRLLPPG
jgi:CheY-like chemotaxis protein